MAAATLDYDKLARAYFAAWNSHDAAAVGAAFAETGTLRDWDISKSGRSDVAAANAGIFKAVPNIKIEVLTIHVSPSTASATAEILVHVNNDAKEVLKVVDVITFDQSGLIKELRAYKG